MISQNTKAQILENERTWKQFAALVDRHAAASCWREVFSKTLPDFVIVISESKFDERRIAIYYSGYIIWTHRMKRCGHKWKVSEHDGRGGIPERFYLRGIPVMIGGGDNDFIIQAMMVIEKMKLVPAKHANVLKLDSMPLYSELGEAI